MNLQIFASFKDEISLVSPKAASGSAKITERFQINPAMVYTVHSQDRRRGQVFVLTDLGSKGQKFDPGELIKQTKF